MAKDKYVDKIYRVIEYTDVLYIVFKVVSFNKHNHRYNCLGLVRGTAEYKGKTTDLSEYYMDEACVDITDEWNIKEEVREVIEYE